MANRYVDDRVNEGLDTLRAELRQFWNAYSQPFRVQFPDMNVPRDIAHGMAVAPDGFFLVFADADVIAEPGMAWTDQLAYLRAGAINAHALIIFYTLREDPIDA